MTDSILRDPIRFASHDGSSVIHGYVWHDTDAAGYKATVQIAHGMAEHIGRYDEFARFLVSRGYLVCGHDHIGHGASSSPERWGCLPGENGKEYLIADMHELRNKMVADYGAGGAPYFLFGHSLGSYLTRAYVTRHGGGLAGAVICGTGHVPPATSKLGNLLATFIARRKGEDTKSKLLDGMGVGAYNKGISSPRTPVDWLSFDEQNVDRYVRDERCGFMFSAGGYQVVTSLTEEVCSPKSACAIPKNLPLLYVSGECDPVGDSGAGVRTAAALARDAGVADVEVKLYENMRHEILAEAEHERVFADIAAWLDEHAAPQDAAQ